MAEITLDYRQPDAAFADHFSFFYLFTSSGDRFSAQDRADFAQFRIFLRGKTGTFESSDGQVHDMPEISILGPTTGTGIISGEGDIEVIGVGLMPAGWAALVPMDASAAANRMFDAVDLFGPVVRKAQKQLRATDDFDARVKIFEALLTELMSHEGRDYEAFVGTVNEWLADSYAPDVNNLIARTGLSRRQLERKCNRFFGSPPKLLARKYRTLRAAVAITHHDDNIADILAEGFYDQSHFIREMKHFTGMTPAKFAEQPTELNIQIAKRIELERKNPMKRTVLIT